jgi:release factor glutamine methyltransferase
MVPDSFAAFRQLVKRRRDREPLQHITGRVEFMDHEFVCRPGALIPRPETEILYQIFRDMLSDPGVLVDVGTGSGVLAISLAFEFPGATVVASDISEEALALAAGNIAMLGVSNVLPMMGDLLAPLGKWVSDGIVANLPYIPSHEIAGLQPEVRLGDPAVALDGGADGLDLVRVLLDDAPRVLRDSGVLAMELDPSQVGEVSELLNSCGSFHSVEAHKDLTGRTRFITAVRGRTPFNLK